MFEYSVGVSRTTPEDKTGLSVARTLDGIVDCLTGACVGKFNVEGDVGKAYGAFSSMAKVSVEFSSMAKVSIEVEFGISSVGRIGIAYVSFVEGTFVWETVIASFSSSSFAAGSTGILLVFDVIAESSISS